MPHLPPESQAPIVIAEMVEPSFGNSRVLPANQQRSCFIPALIIIGMCLLLLLAFGVGLWQFLAPPVVNQTAAERSAANDAVYEKAHQAFSNDWQADDVRELVAIERLVKKVSKIANYEVNPQLPSIIDYSRYAKQMRQYPELGAQAYLGDKILGLGLTQRLYGPIPFSDFRIFKVETLRKNERLVYLQTSGEYGDATPYLWWIILKNRQWKLYDWHPLEYSISDAHESAVLDGEPNQHKTNEYARYYPLCTALNSELESDSETGSGTRIEALFQQIESLSVPDQVTSTVQFDTAFRRFYAGNDRAALRIANAIADPESTPGVYRLLGKIHISLDDYESAIESLNLYLNRVGPDIETLTLLADCYREISQPKQERIARRAAVRLSTTDYQSIGNLCRLVLLSDEDQVATLYGEIDQRRDAEEIYNLLIEHLGYSPFFQLEIEQLVKHLEEIGAGQGTLDQAHGNLKLVAGEFKTGFELLYQSWQTQVKLDRESYWDKALELGQIVPAYRTVDDKVNAFTAISERYESYDYDFSLADFGKIVMLHSAQYPNDPMVTYYRGMIAFSDSNYDQVIELYRSETLESWKIATDHGDEVVETFDDASYIRDEISRMLAISYFHLKQIENAIEAAKSSSAIESIFELALKQHDLEMMERLLKVESWEEDDHVSAEAKWLSARGDVAAAKEMLIQFINENSDNQQGYDQYNYTTYFAISSLMDLCSDRLQAFDLAPTGEFFSRCFDSLIQDQDWKRAQTLIDRMYAQDESSELDSDLKSRIATTQVELLWKQKEYQQLIEQFALPTQEFDLDEIQLSEDDWEFVVRAAIRANDLPAARRVAEQLSDQFENRKMLALVLLHEKRIAESAALIQRMPYEQDFYYYDFDTPALSTTEFAELKSAKPRDLLNYEIKNGTTINLLLAAPMAIDADDLTETNKLFLNSEFSILNLGDPTANQESWMFRNQDFDIAMTKSSVPWRPSSDPVNEQLQQKLSWQKSVLSLHVRATSPAGEGRERIAGMEVALQFLKKLPNPTDCLLVGIEDCWLDWETSQAAIEQFSNQQLGYRNLCQQALETWLYPDADVDSISPEKRHAFERSLAEAVLPLPGSFAEIQGNPVPVSSVASQPLIVFVRLSAGQATESVSIQIHRIEKSEYGSARFVGSLVNDCRLDPSLRAGDRVQVWHEWIEKWEQGNKKVTLVNADMP